MNHPVLHRAGTLVVGALAACALVPAAAHASLSGDHLQPNPEGEQLRGVHDFRAIDTLRLSNDPYTGATGTITADAYLPAGLEFLGCGAAGDDNGTAPEYPGSGPLNATTLAGVGDCPEPTLVETVQTDPDGIGALPSGVFTHVRWTLPSMAPGTARDVRYVVGVPQRQNAMWPGAPPARQDANLDNNTGDPTYDEQPLTTYVAVASQAFGSLGIWSSRTAEDLRVVDGVSPGSLAQNEVNTWRLDLATSEYRAADDVVVDETVPNGLCPLGSAACPAGAGDAPAPAYAVPPAMSPDGRWALRWTVSHIDASDTRTIAYRTRARVNYEGGSPLASSDSVSSATIVTSDGPGDASSATIVAAEPSIVQEIQASPSPAAADCATAAYSASAGGAHRPGDRVCLRVRATFPAGLDTRGVRVTGALPANATYVPGSATGAPAANGNALAWDLGDDIAPGTVFTATYAVTLGSSPSWSSSDQLTASAVLNWFGTFGSARSAGDTTTAPLARPALALTKGVRTLNGDAPRPADADGLEIHGGDAVEYRIDVSDGAGAVAVDDAEVWDRLPTGISCDDVTGASLAGTCTDGIVRWSGLALAAGASSTLTYTVHVPSAFPPASTLTNTAGVRTYGAATNTGTPYAYVPASNIDPALTAANAPALRDTSGVVTADAAIAQTAGATTAAVGEPVDYTVTARIPAASVLRGTPAIAVPLGPRLTLVAGSVTATLDTGDGEPVALPSAGWTVGVADATITVAHAGDWTNPGGSGDDVIVLTYRAAPADVSANSRGAALTATATLSYDAASKPAPATVTLVEPDIALTHVRGGSATIASGGTRTFTLTASNRLGAGVSTAHDLTMAVVLPDGLEPVPGALDGGAWDPDGRTITWTAATLPAGASIVRAYDVEATDVTAGAATTLTASLTYDGVAGAPPPAQRTSTASGTAAALSVAPIASGHSVTSGAVTVGDAVAYAIDVTIPAHTRAFDLAAIATLPADVVYDALASVTCGEGCTAPPVHVFAPTAGDRVTFFLGDVAPTAAERVVRIAYAGHVAASWTSGAATSSASTYSDDVDRIAGTPATQPAPSAFDNATGPVTASVTPVEPDVAIDQTVTGGAPRPTQPGEVSTYAVAVTNDGAHPAYDVVVRATPDALIGQPTPTAGASDVTHGWTAAEPYLEWTISGPIAPGATATVRYAAAPKPSPAVADGAALSSAAAVSSYRGRSAAACAVPGAVCRAYAGPADAVTLTMDLPSLETGVAVGDGANAEVGQPFAWRATVANEATTADADGVDLTAALPAGWSYVPGSATADGAPLADPAGSSTLTWADVADLGPGDDVVVAFAAKPTTAALATGTGAGHPHTLSAEATGSDGSGYSGYASASAAADAVLRVPVLGVDAGPDAGPAVAGTPATLTIVVGNSGPVPARHVRVRDPLPAGVAYEAGSATAAPSAGFSELGYDAPTRTAEWEIAAIAPGADVTIAVPVTVDHDVAAGVTLTNSPSATSDEQPVAATGSGSLLLSSGAALSLDMTGPPSATAGDTIEYGVRIDNAGPSDARDTVVTDVLPDGLEFVSAPGCERSGQTVTCDAGTVRAGSSATRTLRVRIAAGAAGTIVNGASVATATAETDTSDNAASVSTALAPAADVSVDASAAPAALTEGETTTLTLIVRNGGPSAADGVVAGGTLPDGLTLVSAAPSQGTCAAVGAGVSCALGTIGDRATASVRIDARATAPGTRTVTAAVTAATPDPVSGNDAARTDVTVGAIPPKPLPAQLSLTGASTALLSGAGATYRLVVRNTGAAAAAGVVLRDALPAGVEYVRSEPTQGSCRLAGGVVGCALGTIPAGRGAAVQVVARVGAAAGTPLRNTALVEVGGTVVASADVDGVTRGGGAAAAHTLELTAEPSADPPVVGERFAYALTVRNRGKAAAAGVVVTDPIPEGLAIEGARGPRGACDVDGGVVVCPVGSVRAGKSAVVTVQARGPAAAQVTNVAVVAADGTPAAAGRRIAASELAIGTIGRLELSGKAAAKTVRPGRSVAFRATLTAGGAATGTSKVCVAAPSGVTIARAKGAKVARGRACWTAGKLAKGRRRTFALTLRAKPGARGTKAVLLTATGGGARDAEAEAALRIAR